MIAYLDLLALPYVLGGLDPEESLDCRGLALEIYRREGIELAVEDFEPGAEGWEEIEIDYIEPLDVVATDPEGLGYVTGVAIALSGAPGAFAITSVPREGVKVLPVARLARRLGVYRRIP